MAQAAWMGGQERERIECLPDDLRAFSINADHWSPAAQDEGEWRRTAEQGAECFIAKLIAAEKAKQRMVSLFVLVRSPLVKATIQELIFSGEFWVCRCRGSFSAA